MVELCIIMLPRFGLRRLENCDLERAGQLLVQTYPHRGREPASWHRPAPREQPQRWGVFLQSIQGGTSSEEILAYAALWRVEGDKFRFDAIVSLPYRGKGLGHRLVEMLIHEARHLNAATLQARASGEHVDALGFLARREFVETMRMHGFVLDLTTLDTNVLDAQRSVPADISIDAVSLDQARASAFWRKLADLQEAALEGWPDPDPGGPIMPVQVDDLRSMLMPANGLPVAFFVASHGDRFVGYSSLVRRDATGETQFAGTAVRPDFRGRGIATALRARCLVGARGEGYSAVRSASGNEALIHINTRFGFRETYCEVRLVRRLG